MSLTVNTNIPSLDAQRNVGINNDALATSLQRLSSGLRINKAADDAAGLAIATKMDAQVNGLNQAVRNANNAVSLVQTAEGGVNTLTDILQRLRELAVQSSSSDNTASDRANAALEATSLVSEFSRVAGTTQFNTMNLLDGSFTGKYFQIGANYGQTVTFTISDARGKSLGGRAEYTGSIGDGVTGAKNANFGAGQININGTAVGASSAADDQYSVLDISSGGVVTSNAYMSAGFVLYINGNSVTVGAAGAFSNYDASQFAAGIATAIQNAGVTGVTARAVGSTWVLEGTGGTDLNLAIATAGSASNAVNILSAFGISAAVGAMWGSGTSVNQVLDANGSSSAIAKTVAINAISATSGVTATVQPNTITGTNAIGAANLNAGDVYINGYDIGAVTVGANDSTGALAAAINNQTANSGVTASVNASGQLTLAAADGRNITVTTSSQGVGTATLGLKAADATNSTWLYRGATQLDDPNNFSLTSSTSLYNLTGAAGTSLSVASSNSTFNVANVRVDTQANAQAAILTIDSALNQVNNIRAGIGAIQNRLQFTVNNLQISSENMSSSESQIKDADFAAEVATFTRNQIMVQAGTAMVAQANTVSQYALQLLR
ncbi:MAG TPA: flagellin [Syntrophorhabdales bacterium]|nr:flagellin [Syntrophorhabdales bacterium]